MFAHNNRGSPEKSNIKFAYVRRQENFHYGSGGGGGDGEIEGRSGCILVARGGCFQSIDTVNIFIKVS